jgi:hypothetical protein
MLGVGVGGTGVGVGGGVVGVGWTGAGVEGTGVGVGGTGVGAAGVTAHAENPNDMMTTRTTRILALLSAIKLYLKKCHEVVPHLT